MSAGRGWPMSYVSRVLESGESVVYATSLHWRAYLPAVGLAALSVACLVTAFDSGQEYQSALLIAAAVLAVLAFASWLPAAVRRASTELVVTDRRVILKRGIFSRQTIEMNRAKVESVDVDQTIMGRIMGYGTVIVRGTGGGLEPMRNIAHPLTFRSHITAG
jgi:uncharacterized membrane protein YdbT with pleckstrin-like domain